MPGRKKGGGEGGEQKEKEKTKAISHTKNKTPVAALVPIICYLLFP